MPPAQHEDNIMSVDPDGRLRFRFRQSWVNTYMDCPEKARRLAWGDVPRVENDAASLGTALHYAIEDAIDLMMEDGIVVDVDGMIELFNVNWDRMQENIVEKIDGELQWTARSPEQEIQWVKRTHKSATVYGQRCAARFAEHTLHVLDPFATEVPFKVTIYEDEQMVIEITGTIDYLDQSLGLTDWKTASRRYQPWEYRRWAVQPTFYTLGLRELVQTGELRAPEQWHMPHPTYTGPTDTFLYAVYDDNGTKAGPPQLVQVTRDPTWDAHLVDVLKPIADQVRLTNEGHLEGWPKRDQHALCSPKWCPAWDTCKGRHVTLP